MNRIKIAIRDFLRRSPTWFHILLFALTFLTCAASGTLWANKNNFDISNWMYGLQYAVLILTFLSAHEFGHYFAARFHKVDATLPYYIPVPLLGEINFGTFGAVIKTRSPILSRKALFDIGVSGPIAGFVVCIVFLIYGLLTLPSVEYLYQIHPEYVFSFNGRISETGLYFGNTILFSVLSEVFANPAGFLPPMNEIYHYPFLNVGWFGLFVTSLNMLPIGQLDGGHVIYAMFGRLHAKIARAVWGVLVFIGFGAFLGLMREILLDPSLTDYTAVVSPYLSPPLEWVKAHVPIYMDAWFGWLFWAIVTKFFIKLDHPPVYEIEPINTGRKVIGWFAIIILILSFSYTGIYFRL